MILAWTFGNLIYSFRQIPSSKRSDPNSNPEKEFEPTPKDPPSLPVNKTHLAVFFIAAFSFWMIYSSKEDKAKMLIIGVVGLILGILAMKYGTLKESINMDGGGDVPGDTGGGGISPTKPSGIPLDLSIFLIVGLVLAVLGVLLYQKKVKVGREKRSEYEDISSVEKEFSNTLEKAIEELEGGKNVRATIIRCHLQMRYILKDEGVNEKGSMTPRELEEKALDKLSVDREAISDLTELFEEARYSSHRLGESERDRAIDDLERFQEKLGVKMWLGKN